MSEILVWSSPIGDYFIQKALLIAVVHESGRNPIARKIEFGNHSSTFFCHLGQARAKLLSYKIDITSFKSVDPYFCKYPKSLKSPSNSTESPEFSWPGN
jgi:hypothetical protein